jgi:hypothetical protein
MNANVLYFFSFCKPTFSGATREWDALYKNTCGRGAEISLTILPRYYGGEWTASRPGHFNTGGGASVTKGRSGGSQGLYGYGAK